MLDVLRRRGLAATFFVVGQRLEQPECRELAERAVAEGHWIGNHTYTHSMPLGLIEDAATARDEIERTQDLIGKLSHPDRLFRPFGGGGHLNQNLLSRAAVEHLIAGRYTCVTWNAVPRDWEDPDGWAERAVAQCREAETALLVLHDLPTGAMAHLERFLDLAAHAGATFTQTLPDAGVLIRRGKIQGTLDGLVAGESSVRAR